MCCSSILFSYFFFFFFNDTATTEIYTLSLHDALPIFIAGRLFGPPLGGPRADLPRPARDLRGELHLPRSEEHTSELQSRENLVCRLLLEKKKKKKINFVTKKKKNKLKNNKQ